MYLLVHKYYSCATSLNLDSMVFSNFVFVMMILQLGKIFVRKLLKVICD